MVKRMNESFEQGLDMFDKACKKVYGAEWDKKSDKEKRDIIMSFIATAAKKGLDAENGKEKEKKESRSMKVRSASGRRMAEDYDDEFEGGINGYAVEVRDMGRALVHLLLFDTLDEAEGAYKTLCDIEHWADEGSYDDDEGYKDDWYDADISDVFDCAKELTDPIRADWDVDKDGIWESYDGSRYKVINDGAYVDLWLYL